MAYTTIDDPSAHFQTALYSSDSSSVTVTNDGNSDLQPDWIWIKVRNGTNNHNTFDTSRGIANRLKPNTTDAEDGSSGVSVNSDGFATGTSLGDINNTGGANNYVAWQWSANGGTTSSNTDGSITSTVQANTTAGFSIITYTGNGSSGATVGHGLSNNLATIILKRRVDDGSGNNFNWQVWHKSITDDHRGALNTTGAFGAPTDLVFDTSANTTSVLGLGFNNTSNESSKTYVAYCFAEKQGYSKFGSYTGNGNADGPFVYTGFKPAWVMIKHTGASEVWRILDSARDTHNAMEKDLFPNLSNAEGSGTARLDFLSNGFKIRDSGNALNDSGGNLIYWAFAESPFVSSEGVPTTAR